ncbi:MAG: metal ABC transporter permease [Sedimentisphaerales bacterium]|nr:metal ABC transporter permease [Sedimentisphaerales bacterium]
MPQLIQILGLPFLACIVMGAMLSYMGMHVLKREVIFIDIAVAQIAAVGSIAAHLAFDVEEDTLVAYAFSLACVIPMAAFYAVVRAKIVQISIEAVIGISYAITAAAALFLIGIAPGHAHAQEMLAGNLLWVTWRHIILSIAVFCAVGLCFYVFRKPLSAISEQYQQADQSPKTPKIMLWDFLFYSLLGVVITLAVRVTGVVVVFVLLIIPATTSAIFSARLGRRMFIALATVTVATTLGLLFSYYCDFSVGPAVAMLLGMLLGLVAILGKFAKLSRTT